MTKRIVLCADDYGQAPTVSRGIITLIQNGRLSATSCMVNTNLWQEHAKWLLPYQGQIDVGLHINLTEGEPLSKQFLNKYGSRLFPLTTLMRRAFFRALDEKIIEAECEAQIHRFEQALGFLPRFIDGHHHVHHLPQVRSALLKVYEKHLRSQKTYVRLAQEKLNPTEFISDFKKVVIYASGTKALKALLVTHKIPHNQSFAGVYSFSKGPSYKEVFPLFLRKIDDGGLIMCHPGLSCPESEDSIAKIRYEEYRYFFSGQFLEDCIDHGVMIKRFVS